MAMNGENYANALRQALETGETGNIMNGDWHARMAQQGIIVD